MKKSVLIIIISIIVIVIIIAAYIFLTPKQKPVTNTAEGGYYCETIYDCIMMPDECGCERGGKWLLMNQSSAGEYIQKINEDFSKGIVANCTETPSDDPTCIDTFKRDFNCVSNACKIISQ